MYITFIELHCVIMSYIIDILSSFIYLFFLLAYSAGLAGYQRDAAPSKHQMVRYIDSSMFVISILVFVVMHFVFGRVCYNEHVFFELPKLSMVHTELYDLNNKPLKENKLFSGCKTRRKRKKLLKRNKFSVRKMMTAY